MEEISGVAKNNTRAS